MLGDLETDMSKHGVNTQSKGICGACNQPVVGQVKLSLPKGLSHKFACGF